MAGSVADINIKLIANPKGLIDGLSAAEKRLSKFASESKASARAAAAGFTDIGTALTGMSVALTGGAVAAGIKGAIDRLDDLGDKAAGIGETAGNLSRLDYVATRMGSNGDAASAGMNKLVKAIGEAQNGSGDAKKVFDSLGLSIQSLAQMSPTDAMLTVSEAIGRLPGVYEKASAASAIFGKNFAALMPLFNNPDGISEYYDDFARLHGNIDQAAEVAGAAKDQFDRLETAMHGLGEMAVIAFGPAVESMIGAVADRIGEINSSDSGMQKAAEYGQKFAHAFDDMPGKVGDIAEVFQSIARFTKEAMGATKILVSGLLYMKSNISQNALLTTFPVLRNYIDEYPDVKYYKDMADALYKEGQQNIFDAAGMSAAKATAKIDEIGVSAEESGYTVSDSAEKMRIGLDSVGDAAEDADKKISNIGTSAPSTPSDGWSWDKVRQGMMGDLPMTADDIAAIMNGGGDALLSGIQKALQDRGDKLHREAMTPIEQYNEKMDELDKLKQARVLSMEDWTRLEEKFWKEANAGVDDHIDKLDDLDKKQREVFGEPNPFNPSNMVQDASWLNDLYSYNMPPGGFVGGVMPMNFRVFDSPAMAAANGGRQVYDWNSLASQGFDPTENPQLDEANKYLRQIVDNTADMGVYA